MFDFFKVFPSVIAVIEARIHLIISMIMKMDIICETAEIKSAFV